MPDNNNILQKLDGLESRFEEVSTLITDPDVIADQRRYVKLTKEWKDLGDIMNARKRYIACLNAIREAKDILANESDNDIKDMAREELAENETLQPQLEGAERPRGCKECANGNSRRNRWRRSGALCRRFVQHVQALLRHQRLDTQRDRRFRGCRGRL